VKAYGLLFVAIVLWVETFPASKIAAGASGRRLAAPGAGDLGGLGRPPLGAGMV